MPERRPKMHDRLVDRESVMRDYIFPQINRLVEKGFHVSFANAAYMNALDVRLRSTSALEARFRTQMHDTIVLPDSIENLADLVLVIPTLSLDQQASRLNLFGFSQWDGYVYPDKNLPQVPYVLEIKRGDANQSPQKFVRKANGLLENLMEPVKTGSLESIHHGLNNIGMRGLNGYELVAYTREHKSDFEQIHGINNLALMGEIFYYPAIFRDGKNLFSIRTLQYEVPNSMAEIIFTKKEMRFTQLPRHE